MDPCGLLRSSTQCRVKLGVGEALGSTEPTVPREKIEL